MTAQLFEVKSKFSEYVSLARAGEVIEVCKYGKPVVVMLSSEQYAKNMDIKTAIFKKRFELWQKQFSFEDGFSEDDIRDMEKNRKEDFGYREIFFDEER